MCFYTLWRLLHRIEAKTKSGSFWPKVVVPPLPPTHPTAPTTQNYHFFDVAPYPTPLNFNKWARNREQPVLPLDFLMWHQIKVKNRLFLIIEESSLTKKSNWRNICLRLDKNSQESEKYFKYLIERTFVHSINKATLDCWLNPEITLYTHYSGNNL